MGFIVQTEETYGAIVRLIAAFYQILYADDTFSGKFPEQFSILMEGFYNDSEIRKVRHTCSKVQEHLQIDPSAASRSL